MAKPKRKTLPKDFQELLEAGDIGALKAAFESCDVNARGGSSKQTALGHCQIKCTVVRSQAVGRMDASSTQTAKPVPLLQLIAGGDPAGSDDVRAVSAVALKRRGPAV